MKTTILTVLLAATAVMGAETAFNTNWNLKVWDILGSPPKGFRWQVDDSHRTAETILNADAMLKLVRDAPPPVVTNKLSLNVFASTSITNLVLSKEQIEHLCSSGQVCNVKGHMWRDGRPGEGNGAMYADFHPGVSYRTCKICGKCQTKSEEWKD